MGAPPNPTEPPASGRALAWIVGLSLLLWFVIIYAVRKGMT